MSPLLCICQDCQKTSAPEARALSSVAADINWLLRPKTYEQLQNREVQVRRTLSPNEPIYTDYWEWLLRLKVWKSRVRLRNIYQAVIDERLRDLRKQHREEAESVRGKLAPLAPTVIQGESHQDSAWSAEFEGLDLDPLLQVRAEDKGLDIMNESSILRQMVGPQKLLHTILFLLKYF